MANSRNLISDLRRQVAEHLHSGDTEFAMMTLRMLEKQCRIESDDDGLAYSLEQQVIILRKSGETDRADQLQREMKNIRERQKKHAASGVQKAAGSGSAVVETSGHYLRTSCNSFIDTKTNLEWYMGPDVSVSLHEAISWISGLKECGGGWRMPAVLELARLYQKRGGGGLNGNMDRLFPKMGGSFVWSGEERGSSEMHVFFFEFGTEFTVPRTRVSDCRVLAVRTARRP